MERKNNFKWKSLLGFSVVIFLLYGVFNFVMGIVVPYNLHTKGAAAMGGLVISESADSKLLGMSLSGLKQASPGLNDFMVSFMDTMCMMMVGFGIFQLAVVWFALKHKQIWALWTLAIADLSFIPYWQAIANTYSRYGVSHAEVWGAFGNFFYIVAALVLLATFAGWKALKAR